jgi:phosphatidylglycerol:prolipoprotein diacylglycerol transferase
MIAAYVNYPSWITPEIIPGLPIRWYGLMYLFAFATTYIIASYQLKVRKRSGISKKKDRLVGMSSDDLVNLFLFLIVGLLLGARLFAALLYDPSGFYLSHPWLIFWPFRNGSFVGLQGMSYHGGVVGAVVGGLIFAKRYKYNFFQLSDLIIAGVPLGYTFGRLGNFINGELWGRVTTKPWGMIFPHAPTFSTRHQWVQDIAREISLPFQAGDMVNLPRHPSQLYEAFFEGIFLFLILFFIFRKKKTFHGQLLSLYLIGYGLVRFFIEYVREPDADLGFIISLGDRTEPTALLQSAWNFSMGQILCLLMIIGGGALYLALKGRYPAEYPKSKKEKARSRNKK